MSPPLLLRGKREKSDSSLCFSSSKTSSPNVDTTMKLGVEATLFFLWALLSTCCSEKFLGRFEIAMHGVQGGLFELSPTKLRIHRFYYDGEGPNGVRITVLPVGAGNTKAAYTKALPVRSINEISNELQLPAIYNQNLTFNLPDNLKVSEVSRVLVWCPEYEVSFGRVDLDESRRSPPPQPDPLTSVGSFIQTEHEVAGDVFIRDDQNLIIRDFNYDGRGPSVVFFAGEDDDLGTGEVVQYPYKKHVGLLGPDRLKRIVKRDIVLRLPNKLNARKLRWLSVWCDTFEVSFGHVLFPRE